MRKAARACLAALLAGLVLAGPFGVLPALGQGPDSAPNGPPETAPEDTTAQAPAGPVRPFAARASFGLNEYYDSNPTGAGRSDAVTQGQADISLHDQTLRFQGDLAYSASGYYHAATPDLNAIENYLNAIGRAEIYPEHLFVNARAFAWPTSISRLGSVNAGGSATANNQNAYGYAVNSDFAWRFGDIASSDLIVGQSGEFFSSLANSSLGNALPFAGPANAQTSSVSLQVKGGDYFERLEWVATASGANSTQTGLHQKQRAAEADLEFHLDRNFGIIADVGYRHYDSQPSLTRSLSGVTAMGGFSFQPNESLSAVVKAGTQYQFTSFTGNVRYQFTASSQAFLALDDVVTTPQDRLLLGLNGLTSFQQGFYQPGTLLPNQASLPGLPANLGSPVNPTPLDGLALDNIISRYRTLALGLVHKMPRTTMGATLYGTVRDYLLPLPGFDMRQTVYGIDFTATRELNRNLSGTVAFDYSVAREFGGTDRLGTISALMNYTISEKWSANLRINYLDRQSHNSLLIAQGSFGDVQAGLGMRYSL